MFFSFSALMGAPAADTKTVAKYVLEHAEELFGEKVSLDVTHVVKAKTPAKAASAGLAMFKAHTFDKKKRMKGGNITVVVLADEAEKFARQYGTSPEVTVGNKRRADTRVFRGVLGKTRKGQWFVCKDKEIHSKVPNAVALPTEEE